MSGQARAVQPANKHFVVVYASTAWQGIIGSRPPPFLPPPLFGLPRLDCSIPPRPHGLVFPARADHLPVGRPVDSVDLTKAHVSLFRPPSDPAGAGFACLAYLVF